MGIGYWVLGYLDIPIIIWWIYGPCQDPIGWYIHMCESSRMVIYQYANFSMDGDGGRMEGRREWEECHEKKWEIGEEEILKRWQNLKVKGESGVGGEVWGNEIGENKGWRERERSKKEERSKNLAVVTSCSQFDVMVGRELDPPSNADWNILWCHW